MRSHAQPALSLLPTNHWAFTGDVPRYDYNPERAESLLDASGHVRAGNGVRFHLTMKTSNDEGTRLLAASAPTTACQGGHCPRSAQL